MQLRSKLVPPAIVSDDISNRENRSRKRTRSDQSIHNTNVTQNSTKTYYKLTSMSTSANKTTIENRATERLKKSKKEPNNTSENIKNDENVSHTNTEPDTVLVPISNYRKEDKKKRTFRLEQPEKTSIYNADDNENRSKKIAESISFDTIRRR